MAAGTAPRLKRLLTKAGRPCALREPEMDCEGPNRASPGRQAAARPGEAQSWQASAPSAEGSCGGASARRGHIRHGRIRLVSVRGRESSQAGAPGQAEDVTARLTSPGCWKLGAVTVRFRDDDGPSPRSRGELCCSVCYPAQPVAGGLGRQSCQRGLWHNPFVSPRTLARLWGEKQEEKEGTGCWCSPGLPRGSVHSVASRLDLLAAALDTSPTGWMHCCTTPQWPGELLQMLIANGAPP